MVDCCDNFTTRQAINRACVQAGKPLVSGAAIGFSGQIAVFNLGAAAPCYSCLYPDLVETQLTCSQSGVIAPLVGVIGSYQALEAVKIMIGCGESLAGRLQLFDGLRGNGKPSGSPKTRIARCGPWAKDTSEWRIKPRDITAQDSFHCTRGDWLNWLRTYCAMRPSTKASHRCTVCETGRQNSKPSASSASRKTCLRMLSKRS